MTPEQRREILKKREELEMLGGMASMVSTVLNTIDGQFVDDTSRQKNKANKINPRVLYERAVKEKNIDLAQQLVTEDNVREIEPSLYTTSAPPAVKYTESIIPPKPLPPQGRLIKESKDTPELQLEFDFVDVLEDPSETKKLFKILDQLSIDIKNIKKILQEVEQNTRKRKYKKKDGSEKIT